MRLLARGAAGMGSAPPRLPLALPLIPRGRGALMGAGPTTLRETVGKQGPLGTGLL